MTSNGHHPTQAPTAPHTAPGRVAVLLSQRLATVGQGVDVAALREWLETTEAAVQAHVVQDLVRQPGQIARLIAESGARHLVLVPTPGELSIAEAQTQARKAGLDPLGIVVLDLGPHALLASAPAVATERARLLLGAAIARARAFPGSGPEHLKPSLSVSVSRRALFSLAVHEYRPVPAAVPALCAADRGCRRCLDACPQDALRLRNRQVELNKTRCESCGLCQTACPTGAMAFPTQSSAELEAEIGALLGPTTADLAPRGILFVCRQSAPVLEASIARGFRHPAGWLPVSVPCAGSLSPSLILRSLALGAAAVGIAACRDECAFRQGDTVTERVAFCQELLRQLGDCAERVRFCPVSGDDPSAWALPDAPLVVPTASSGWPAQDPRAASAALLRLAEACSAPVDLVLSHPQSPWGSIALDREGCTACEACAKACPTGALAAERDGGAIGISFDAALCTACGLCVPRCPEVERGVLRLRREVDLRRLGAGRTIIYRDQTPRCVKCGAAVAPAAMIARVAALLGDDYPALAATVTSYCMDCRGVVSRPPTNGVLKGR